MRVSKDPKKPAKRGFPRPKGIPPKARPPALDARPQRAPPFPRSQPNADPSPEDLTVPELDYRKRQALGMPVPTSQNQRATQMLTSRTDVDSAAPTLLDPPRARPSVAHPPSPARPRKTHPPPPTRPRKAHQPPPAGSPPIKPWRRPTVPSYGRKLREQMAAQLQARVVELTANIKDPTQPPRPRPGPGRNLADQVTTSDVLEAMENLGEAAELDLSNGAHSDPGQGPAHPGESALEVEPAPLRDAPPAAQPKQPDGMERLLRATLDREEQRPEEWPDAEESSSPEEVEQLLSDEYEVCQPDPGGDDDIGKTGQDPPPVPVPPSGLEPEVSRELEAAPEVGPVSAPEENEAEVGRSSNPGEDETPPLPDDAGEDAPSPPRDVQEVVDGETLVWMQGELTPVGVPYDAVPPHDLEGVDVYGEVHSEVMDRPMANDEEPTASFESPWSPRQEQDLQAVAYQAEMDHHPGHDLDDHRTPDQRMLGGPRRVEIRQVTSVKPDARLVLLTAPSTSSAEQYRVLSLKLKENAHIRSIGVMSPTEDVGAEVVGANLALALAEGNRSRVCMVDGDMRRSSMARLLGLKEGPSLADQVRLHRRDPDAPWVVLGMGPSFHLIPGTRRDPNPAELLNSEALLDMMDELRREFDFIIITTPPLLDSADGVILQEHSDGVILAARACVTRQDAMKASLNHLTQGKVLGTVLVDAPKMPHL